MGKIRELTVEDKMSMRLDDIIYYDNIKMDHELRPNVSHIQEYERMQCDENQVASNDSGYVDEVDDVQYNRQERRVENNRYNNQLRRNYNFQCDTRVRRYHQNHQNSYPYYNARRNQNNRWKQHRSPAYWNDRLIQRIQSAPHGSVFRRLEVDLPYGHVIPGTGHTFYNCTFNFH